MGENYFNSIPWREARLQLRHCRAMAMLAEILVIEGAKTFVKLAKKKYQYFDDAIA